jgi:hypothetical protein
MVSLPVLIFHKEKTMNDILTELRAPFHPSAIQWKPGSVNKDQTKALAMAYADLRAYQNRLDEVLGLDWSVSYLPWGEGRIVCHLTISGVTRSSTGEAGSQSERNEIGGTSAEAQAMKRACSAFGLGRYLYELPTVWVELDDKKNFTPAAKAKLDGLVANHYRRYIEQMEKAAAQATGTVNQESGEESDESLRKLLDSAGQELYGDRWEQIARHNAERVSNGRITDPAMLDSESIRKLLKGVNDLKAKRQPA